MLLGAGSSLPSICYSGKAVKPQSFAGITFKTLPDASGVVGEKVLTLGRGEVFPSRE